MKVLEIEGKTIDEAIEKACREFNVPREKLNIEILSEGSSGFLGLVASKKARIKANLLSLDMSFETPREKAEKEAAEKMAAAKDAGKGGAAAPELDLSAKFAEFKLAREAVAGGLAVVTTGQAPAGSGGPAGHALGLRAWTLAR